MSGKLKLSISALSLLGLNGVTFLTIDNQFNILDSLKDFTVRGGHWLTELDSFKGPSNRYKLDIEDRNVSSGVQFDSSSTKLPETKLELQATDSKLDLSELTPVDKSVGDKVTGVWKEVEKEVKVGGIWDKATSNYENLKSKHLKTKDQVSQLSEFHKTKEKVDNWAKTRNKVKAIFALTQSQRTNLQTVYEFHDALKNERDKLKSELGRYSNLVESFSLASIGVPTATEVKAALNKMGWQQEKIKLQPDSVSGRILRRDDWRVWNNNPYKLFYEDLQQWKKDTSLSRENTQKARRLKRSIEKLSSIPLTRWFPKSRFNTQIRRDLQELAEVESTTNAHIELQVADKLLRYMNSPRS